MAPKRDQQTIPASREGEPAAVQRGVPLETVALIALTMFAIGALVGRTAKVRREVFGPNTAASSHHAEHALPTGHPPLEQESAPADPEEVAAQVAQARESLSSITDRTRLVEMGNRSFDDGQAVMAIAAYELALEQNDQDPDVWTDMGVMYRQVRLPQKAVESFRKAMEINPRHPQSRLNTAIVLAFDLGQVDEALQELRTLGDQDPPDSVAQQARDLIGELERIKEQAAAAPPAEQGAAPLQLGADGKRIMVEMGSAFTGLANAARDGSLEAARPEMARMEKLAGEFAALPPVQQLGSMMIQPFQRGVDQLKQVVADGKVDGLQGAVTHLQERCNRCHEMMKVETRVE